MSQNILQYQLSEEADNDLNEIYNYTELQFGTLQAIKYLSGFETIFDIICRNPKSGRERLEIRNELRSISYQSHIVFYRIVECRISIIRILHASRDIIKFISSD